MSKSRPAPGGGVVVEVEPARLTGWVNRFAARNDGIAAMTADGEAVTITGGNGTTATAAVPFPPMRPGDREPIEALLHHLSGLGTAAVILYRGGAHCMGLARDGEVLVSSTDRTYLQGRTAAGGWSQQRYARRRSNQKDAAIDRATDLAARVLLVDPVPDILVLGGERAGLTAILQDPRLRPLADLPRREFPDIPEPRRVVLDDIALRLTTVEITVRTG